MNFSQSPEFQKELKKLSKKWRSLPADVGMLTLVITALYTQTDDNAAIHLRETFFAMNKGAVLKVISSVSEVVKVRLDSSDINKDMLRVVFIQFEDKIMFIELYAKNSKSREDITRIKKYLKNKSNSIITKTE